MSAEFRRMRRAKLAYEAYRAHTGGVSLASGQKIPPFDMLRPEIQDAWGASATALDSDLGEEDENPGPPPDGPGGGSGQ